MPTTTVKSTDLDFDNIKTSLKNFLKADTQFADYDFDAAGLNNILDVNITEHIYTYLFVGFLRFFFSSFFHRRFLFVFSSVLFFVVKNHRVQAMGSPLPKNPAWFTLIGGGFIE